MLQAQAVLAATLIVALAAVGQRLWAARARGLGLAVAAVPTGEAHVLYFSGPNCSICRTHQEPALEKLAGVSIRKIDAVEERELADRYRVFTVPTTVVVSATGEALHVNYGYTTSRKLLEQLSNA